MPEELTAVCVTVSEPKKVARATITPHGRTIICSLCVLRRPKRARILRFPAGSFVAGHAGSVCVRRQLKLLDLLRGHGSLKGIIRIGNTRSCNMGTKLKHGLVALFVSRF